MIFRLSSGVFEYGKLIPDRYTCEGDDLSPPLVWDNIPEGTESFVLVMDDPDAPSGTWVHWLLYDIPSRVTGFEEGASSGLSGVNSWGRTGYGGPCPPHGHGVHRYFFKVYALDTLTIDLPEGADVGRVKAAMNGHVLAVAEHMGKYERK